MKAVGKLVPHAHIPQFGPKEPALWATYTRVWLRGFVMVALVAANTRQIAAGHYGGAFVVGGLISLVWWSNSSKHREDVTGAGALYALGAAMGTVFGMWIGG